MIQAEEAAIRTAGRDGSLGQKFCHGCARWLNLVEFSYKDPGRNMRRSQCRACCRERSRRHYMRMKAAYLQRNRGKKPLLRETAAKFVHGFLLQNPCIQCGEGDPIVLEFNHLDPASKSANISEMIRTGTSVRRLQVEIAKCEVLCANCHQRHTIASKAAHYKTVVSTCGPSWRQAANRRNGALVLEHLGNAVCIDCGIVDPLVLQFDHKPGEAKVKDIGWFVSSGSRIGLLVEELARCDVRCANCHRRRTAQSRNWFRARVSIAKVA